MDTRFQNILGCVQVCLLIINGAEKIETRDDLQFWFVCLDDRADDCDVDVLGADIVG